jgi:hypothetical protein
VQLTILLNGRNYTLCIITSDGVVVSARRHGWRRTAVVDGVPQVNIPPVRVCIPHVVDLGKLGQPGSAVRPSGYVRQHTAAGSRRAALWNRDKAAQDAYACRALWVAPSVVGGAQVLVRRKP